MPLTPSQILSANHAIFGGGPSGGGSALRAKYRNSDKIADLLDEEESPDSRKPSPSILERVKGGLGDVVEPVGRALDAGRAAVVAGAVETGDLLRDVSGLGDGNAASLDDLRANFNRRIGVGDVLEENELTTGLPLNVKRGLGLAGDLATDPLNFVTLGQSTVAKQGLRRLAYSAGDDVAEIAARDGIAAANERIAAKLAADPESVAGRSVEEILGRGVAEGAEERVLGDIARTGRGGVGVNFGRLGGGTLVEGERLAPLGRPFRAAGEAVRGTETAASLRKALVPLSETRDAFGRTVADALPGIIHRRTALVDAAKVDLDNRLKPILTDAVGKPELDAIRAALDVGGTYEATAAALADNPDALSLLNTLSDARDEAYDALINAGKNPDELMSRGEYLRHVLTEEGMEALGIKNASRSPGSRAGRFKSRTREGSIDDKIAQDGVVSYVDDPVRLVRSSFHYAQDVGGNAMAADALEDLVTNAKNLPNGIEPSDVIRHSPAEGFTEIAPGRYVADQIYEDAFNLSRAATQNSIVRAWDNFSSIVKRQTLFNPVSFGPYFTQNMATGVGMNAVDGVRAADYALTARLHRASARALKEGGEKGYDEALARLLSPEDAALAKEMRAQNIFGAGHSLYDDVARDSELALNPSRARRAAEFGTQHTTKVNAWGEEMLRGSAYARHRLNGLTADQAAALVRQRHLDYTGIGRTAFERNVINRFVFFPTWLMRAPSAIVRAYAHSPGAFNAQARVEMGTDWYERDRNQYGELLGARLSGPASFLTGLSYEAGGEPVEMLNPLAQAVLNKDSRHLTDVLPPLSNVVSRPGSAVGGGRVGGIVADDERRSRYLRSLGAVRTGVDYDTDRGRQIFEQSLAERAAERERREAEGEPDLPEHTEKQRLVLAALDAGVENPYRMTSGELARRLTEAGATERDLRDILKGR